MLMQTIMVFATITNNPELFRDMAGEWEMPGVADMAEVLEQATAEAVVQGWAAAVHFRLVRVVDLVRVRAAEQHPVADTSSMKIKTGSVMSTKKAFPNKI
jgi:hypothetical protein